VPLNFVCCAACICGCLAINKFAELDSSLIWSLVLKAAFWFGSCCPKYKATYNRSRDFLVCYLVIGYVPLSKQETQRKITSVGDLSFSWNVFAYAADGRGKKQPAHADKSAGIVSLLFRPVNKMLVLYTI